MLYDVVVVGGGPAGCFTAAEVAREGFKVLVLEEHKKIGEPVQCAGLVSPRTLNLVSAPQSLVIKEYRGARILSPLGGDLLINGDRVYAQAVDRGAFDRYLAGLASDAGAEIMTGCSVTGVDRRQDGFTVTVNSNSKRERIRCRLLIGADGVNSRVAKWLGLEPVKNKIYMYAGEFELSHENPPELTVLLGQTFAPGWFGWVIPLEGRAARVGVGGMHRDKSPRQYLKGMIDKFPSIFKNFRELEYTGGAVPFGIMRKIYSSNALLVGDAAAQTKPISGGGIYTGLRGALICSRVAVRSLREENLGEKFLSEYQHLWDREFHSEFQSGLRHRETYSSMADDEVESLIQFLDRPYWRRLIAGHGDIDYPSWLARRLFKAGPWVQKFAVAAIGFVNCGKNLKRAAQPGNALPF
ncbi:MAG: geranylgeranyl reductase family protein [Bacillota bacterium]